MKKLSLFVGGMIFLGVVLVQKFVVDVLMIFEGVFGFNYFMNGFVFGNVIGIIVQFVVCFCYFFIDNVVGCLILGFNNVMSKYNFYENVDFIGVIGEYKIVVNNWSVGIGGEYYFVGIDCFFLFGVLNIMFGGGFIYIEGINVFVFLIFVVGGNIVVIY